MADPRPQCAGGLVTREKVEDLAAVVGRIEAKINALLGGLALAVAVEIIRSLNP